MLVSRVSGGLRALEKQGCRNVAVALDGYFPQYPHPSDPNYQTEVQRRIETRLKARDENEKARKFFGRVTTVPEFPDSFTPTDLSKCDARPFTKMIPVKRCRVGLIGKKVGMMNLYDEHGQRHPCTVLHVDNNEVLRMKLRANHPRGLSALLVGWGNKKLRSTDWGRLGEYNKFKVSPKKRVVEFHVSKEALLPPGTHLDVRHFLPGQKVDIQGQTKFKRWCGVVKRWGFAGGPASHNSTCFHRRPGSIGHCADPGKIMKGKKMMGPVGGKLRWQRHQYIMRIDPRNGLLFVRGQVPCVRNAYCKIVDSFLRAPLRPPFPTYFPDPEEVDPGPPCVMKKKLRFDWTAINDPDEKAWYDHLTRDLRS